jgi:hypothetical protein
MIKATSVRANDDFTITVQLEDGRVATHDMGYLKELDGPVVDKIKSVAEFRKAFVENGIVAWPSGYDIDPYYLIECSEISGCLKWD